MPAAAPPAPAFPAAEPAGKPTAEPSAPAVDLDQIVETLRAAVGLGPLRVETIELADARAIVLGSASAIELAQPRLRASLRAAGPGSAQLHLSPRPERPRTDPHAAPQPLEVDLLAAVDLSGLIATGAVDAPGRIWIQSAAGPAVVQTPTAAGPVLIAAVRGVALADLVSNVAAAFAPDRPASAETSRHPLASDPAWLDLKTAVEEFRALQAADGSVAEDCTGAGAVVGRIVEGIRALTPHFPHDRSYLQALVVDLEKWRASGFSVPDFLDSLLEFHPERERVDGRTHLVVFPMYTQNGNPAKQLEAVLLQVVWPEFIDSLETGGYSNKMFVPLRFLDFTAGYDTHSAVLFPETVSTRETPLFSWGGIFADREAARFRAVVTAAARVTGLALPPAALELLRDQQLAENVFVMWDLIHDRTHMHGDLPFDPFMIKQRMPYFLYTLEELRCDLTAFRESVRLAEAGEPHARLVQYAILFDRIFRFPVSGTRIRNYDGLGGQLLFAWLRQHGVLHWTDNRLSVEWDRVSDAVLALGREIDQLYWTSIDRPKTAHWLAAYRLVSGTVTPHPASVWAKGADALPLDGPPKGLTDAVLPDEFPLSMFYEALQRKISGVVQGTAGITGWSTGSAAA